MFESLKNILDSNKYLNIIQTSKQSIVISVTVGLFLENMLTTVVYPIMPEILSDLEINVTKSNVSSIINSSTVEKSQENLFEVVIKVNAEESTSDDHFKVGIILASKSIIQIFANPFVGCATNRIGYRMVLVCGFTVLSISTLAFAFGTSYFWLLFARAFQGIGSSCIRVAGIAVIAHSFPDHKERGIIMGYVISGGLALGIVLGPTFGALMYEFVGRSSPFLVLALISFFTLLLQMCVTYPEIEMNSEENDCWSIGQLLLDPYIMIISGSLMLSNMIVAILESSLPMIMKAHMDVEIWQIGMTFLPDSISFMIGACIFGRTFSCIGRSMMSFLGILLMGGSVVAVTLIYIPELLVLPMSLHGFGAAMVDSNMIPELGNRVDLNHSSKYLHAYAIGDIALCAGFAIGPVLAGTLSEYVGFVWMAVTPFLICLAYGPLFFVLKSTEYSPVANDQIED